MNPVVYKFGPLQIHAFTAWIMIGVGIGIAITLGSAARRGERLLPWFDAMLGGVVGGVIGARVVHVWLNWTYFTVHTDQITAISSGGLDWHGALAGGLLSAILIAMLRRLPLLRLLDTFALIMPIGAITVWLACAAANSAYGLEVPTLADFPSWLVIESPDVYGGIAPRLNLPLVGIALGVIVLFLISVLTASRRLTGLRLWSAIVLYGVGMALIDFFRADYVPTWFSRRADQILDLAVVLIAVLLFVLTALLRRRELPGRASTSTVVSQGA